MKEFFLSYTTKNKITKMKNTLSLDFCDVVIYDHYIIVTIKEGTILTPEHNNTLIKITESYFEESPFVYISNRINSYSVNPEIYYKTVQINSLKGFAVVSQEYKAKINAQIEKMFFKKPFEIFSEIEDAVTWAKTLIKRD